MMHIVEVMEMCGPGTYCLIGGAGAGKTTLSRGLAANTQFPVCVYSADWRFIGDSDYRTRLLKEKQIMSLDTYRDACNQFNWWDWNSIARDLKQLADGESVTVSEAYNRDLKTISKVTIDPKPYILYESAIPGPSDLVGTCRRIFYMTTARDVRLTRLIKKDRERRSLNASVARFLVTEYSESLSYTQLNMWFPERILHISQGGVVIDQGPVPVMKEQFIPIQVSM